MRLLTLLATLLSVVLIAPVIAGSPDDAEAAHEAYRTGDDATALRIWRQLADAGNAEAQLALGTMYEFGEGVPATLAEAAKWYRKAAEQGNVEAQLNLGFMHVNGQGVSRDYAKALIWYEKAAQQGSALAQYSVAALSEKGLGTPKDLVKAYKWYSIAAARAATSKEKSDDAIKGRDRVAAQMTPEEIAEARRQASEWKATVN
jgi:TPR repeat protein